MLAAPEFYGVLGTDTPARTAQLSTLTVAASSLSASSFSWMMRPSVRKAQASSGSHGVSAQSRMPTSRALMIPARDSVHLPGRSSGSRRTSVTGGCIMAGLARVAGPAHLRRDRMISSMR